MKYLIIFILLFFPLLLLAQPTKEVKVKFPKSKVVKERYFVEKRNRLMKQGLYQRFDKTGGLRERGNYVSNKKDGLWEQFDERNVLREQGNYDANRKVGKWEQFDESGALKLVTIYKNGGKQEEKRVGVWLEYHESGQVVTGFDYEINQPLEPRINVRVKYPALAREYNIQGVVKARLKLTDACEVEYLAILQGLTKECDESVLESMKTLALLLKKYNPAKCQNFDEVIDTEFKLE